MKGESKYVIVFLFIYSASSSLLLPVSPLLKGLYIPITVAGIDKFIIHKLTTINYATRACILSLALHSMDTKKVVVVGRS